MRKNQRKYALAGRVAPKLVAGLHRLAGTLPCAEMIYSLSSKQIRRAKSQTFYVDRDFLQVWRGWPSERCRERERDEEALIPKLLNNFQIKHI